MPLTTGQTLHNNRYRIVKLIGQGGFGAVYRAWDTVLNQPAALKENLDTSQEAQRQFEREAQMMAGLRHPNLPRVIDHFFLPGQGQYLVMDFVEGHSLAALLDAQGRPFTEAEALPWLEQVCAALDYLHTRQPPIVHRDIKPENIIITPEGQAMLVDFGLSKIYDVKLATTVGARAVTPGYSPPEQYGAGKTDGRTDIYALGATLYRILTGQEPPPSVDIIAGATSLTPPRQLNQQLSQPTEQAILQAMSVNMSQRYDHAADFLNAIKPTPITKTVPVSVSSNVNQPTQITSSTPSTQKTKTYGWVWWLFGLVLIAFGIIAIISVFSQPEVIEVVVEKEVTNTPKPLPTFKPRDSVTLGREGWNSSGCSVTEPALSVTQAELFEDEYLYIAMPFQERDYGKVLLWSVYGPNGSVVWDHVERELTADNYDDDCFMQGFTLDFSSVPGAYTVELVVDNTQVFIDQLNILEAVIPTPVSLAPIGDFSFGRDGISDCTVSYQTDQVSRTDLGSDKWFYFASTYSREQISDVVQWTVYEPDGDVNVSGVRELELQPTLCFWQGFGMGEEAPIGLYHLEIEYEGTLTDFEFEITE